MVCTIPFGTWIPRAKYLTLIDISYFYQMQTIDQYSTTINNNNKKQHIFILQQAEYCGDGYGAKYKLFEKRKRKNPKRNKRKVKTKIIAKLFEICKQMPQKAIMQHLQRLFIGLTSWMINSIEQVRMRIRVCVCFCFYLFVCVL